MTKMNSTAKCIIIILSILTTAVHARRHLLLNARATPNAHAHNARLLVHKSSWATVSTISVQYGGAPFGNIASYSDGIGNDPTNSTGKLYFFLTEMDATAQDLAVNPNASVTISMAQNEVCRNDVEDPTCWRVTLIGTIVPVPTDMKEYALNALFSNHPQMQRWPQNHAFSPYMLILEQVFFLDFYGGAKHIPPSEFFAVKLDSNL